MTIITTLQEIKKEFREVLSKSNKYEYTISSNSYHDDILKETHQRHLKRLLKSFKDELPKGKKIIVTNGWVDGQEGDYSWNMAISATHQLLDNAIKSIEV